MSDEYALIKPDNTVARVEPSTRIDLSAAVRAGWRWVPVEHEAEPSITPLQFVAIDDEVQGNRLLKKRRAASRTVDEQRAAVDAERDRRMSRFVFNSRTFDFGGDSTANINGAGTLALAAIINGAQPGNLRWADPNVDFKWITVGNQTVTMDAQTCFAFAQAAATWKAGHIHAARAIKDMSPIPADYAADARWPA